MLVFYADSKDYLTTDKKKRTLLPVKPTNDKLSSYQDLVDFLELIKDPDCGVSRRDIVIDPLADLAGDIVEQRRRIAAVMQEITKIANERNIYIALGWHVLDSRLDDLTSRKQWTTAATLPEKLFFLPDVCYCDRRSRVTIPNFAGLVTPRSE